MTYDVCVVGAGLAGLYAAMNLSAQGVSVCVVDRRTNIGHPVRCAEATGNREELARFVPVEESWIATDIEGMQLHTDRRPDGLMVRLPDIGVVLHRDLFEIACAHAAQAAGTRFVLESEVVDFIRSGARISGVCTHRGDRIEARFIIGADGPESFVGRMAGITETLSPGDVFPAAQYHVETDAYSDHTLHFFYGETLIRQGYIWVFPKHDGTANVGAGFFGVRNIPAISVLDTFLKTHLPQARIIAKTAGCAPVTPCPKRLHRDNVMVVGDAARQVNPLIAGGIMNALEATHLCTAHLVRALESDSPQAHLARYSRQWQRGQRRQQLFFESVKRMLLSGSTAQVYRLLEKSYSFFTTHVARTTPFRIPLWPTARFLVSILPRYFPHARHLLR